MTNQELKEICEKASPGPWLTEKGLIYEQEGIQRHIAETVKTGVPKEGEEANAAFIATFHPQQVLSLLSRIEELERENALLKEYKWKYEGLCK